MKKCPYCAEEIQDEAIVCRYCGRELQATMQPVPVEQAAVQQVPAQPEPNQPAPIHQTQKVEKVAPKKRNSILIGVILAVLFCCSCGLIRAVATTSTTTPTVVPESQSTEAKSVEEAKGVEPVAPTSTASNTPEPTSAPVETQTSQLIVDDYRIQIADQFLEFASAFMDVQQHLQQAAEDTTVIFDESWKIETGLALGILDFQATEMSKLEPSPGHEQLQSYIVQIAEETHLFTTAYARGVDNLDPDSINTATQHLQNINALMELATAELDRINNNQ